MRKSLMLAVAGACAGLMALGLASVPMAHAADATPAWLGVVTERVDERSSDGAGRSDQGVRVVEVVDDSPADRAGVKEDDIILSMNSRSVSSPRELSDLVRAARPGQTVAIRVWRDGSSRTLSARLTARESGMDAPRARRSYWEDSDRYAPIPPMPPMAPMAPMAPMTPRTPRSFTMWSPDNEVMRGFGRPRLGVTIQEMNGDLGEYFGAKDGLGALVTEVQKGSPADSVGIKPGDVIVQVGDRTIDDTDDLTNAIHNAPSGVTRVTVLRKGSRQTFQPRLEEPVRMRRTDHHHGTMMWKQESDDDRDRDVIIRRFSTRDGDKHVIVRKYDDGDGTPEVFMRGVPRPDDDDTADLKREINELQEQIENLREDLKNAPPAKAAPTKAAPKKSTTTKPR